jgi:hypothetical protein
MHRITDQRVTGSSLKSLRIFEQVCGEENFPYVVLVTSMWDLLDGEADRAQAESRELALRTKDEFFGKMVAGGAKVMRYEGDGPSARSIAQRISMQKSRVVTALQREMADVGKKLEDTAVGAFLREEIDRARRKYELDRQELEEALKEAREDDDEDLMTTISEQHFQLKKRMNRTIADEDYLSATREDLAQDRTEWCTRLLSKAEQEKRELQRSQQQVKALKEELHKKEEMHQKELRSFQKRAKGSEKALAEISHQHERDRRLLQERIAQQTVESEAKAGGVNRLKPRETFFHRIAQVFDWQPFLPQTLGRAQTFSSFPNDPRNEDWPVQDKGKRRFLSKAHRENTMPTTVVYIPSAEEYGRPSIPAPQPLRTRSAQLVGSIESAHGNPFSIQGPPRRYTPPMKIRYTTERYQQ